MKIEKLDIQIQADIGRFKEDLFFGMTLRQFIHVVIGSLCCIGSFFLFKQLELNVIKEIGAVLVALPIFVSGFFTYQGLTLIEYIGFVFKFYTNPRIIVYQDYDVEELIEEVESEEINV